MTRSLTEAIAIVNQDAARFFDEALIDEDCREFKPFLRHRKLPPRAIILNFLRQVLAGNTSCQHVRMAEGVSFSASAYCRGRQNIPLEILEKLQRRICGVAAHAGELWCQRRTILLDGTECSMPDTAELREHFGYGPNQKDGLGFPSAHHLCVFNHTTGMLLEMITGKRCANDLGGVPKIFPALRKNDVLVGDRGFGYFVTLSLCRANEMDAVLRLKDTLVDFTPHRPHDDYRPQKRVKGVKQRRRKGKGKPNRNQKGTPKTKWIRSLGEQDQIVVYRKPLEPSATVSKERWETLPQEMEVRETRFRVARKGWRTEEITLISTLLDPVEFPKEKLLALYLARWKIEGNIRCLKQTLKMDVLKGKSVDVVKKELVMHAIAYNLVQLVRMEASKAKDVAPDRISFIDALRWLLNDQNRPHLRRLVANPLRIGRYEPRSVKRRPKPFPWLTRPRQQIKAEVAANFHLQRLAA